MFASRRAVGVMGIGDVPAFCAPGFTGPLTTDQQATCAAGTAIPDFCAPGFVGPLTPDQQATCQSTATWTYNAPTTTTTGTPVISNTVVLAAAGIAALFLIMAMVKR